MTKRTKADVIEGAVVEYLRTSTQPVNFSTICQNILGRGDEVETAILNLMALGKIRCISFVLRGRLIQHYELIDKHTHITIGERECHLCHAHIHGEQRTVYCSDECADKVTKLRGLLKQWKTSV